MYFLGIILIILCALLINALNGYKAKKNYFIIELPEYKIPSILGAGKSMLSRAWAFIVKAGTVIMVCNFLVHVMQTFDWSFRVVEADQSILHDISTPFAYVLAPIIGVCAWQLAASAVTGFIAKENVVGTLAVCFGISNLISVEELTLIEGAATSVAGVFGITSVGALAFLTFNLFSPPCFAAIGAMRSEISERKWFYAGIGIQIAVGFTVAFLIFFFGSLFTGGSLGSVWMPILGWAIVLTAVIIFTIIILKNRKELKKERA